MINLKRKNILVDCRNALDIHDIPAIEVMEKVQEFFGVDYFQSPTDWKSDAFPFLYMTQADTGNYRIVGLRHDKNWKKLGSNKIVVDWVNLHHEDIFGPRLYAQKTDFNEELL